LQKCVAETVNYNSNSACGSLRIQATAEDAKRANITMTFSAGSAGGAVGYVSYETGLVYGNNGQFGCFATACVGSQSNVSISNFANFGVYNRYEDFVGFSAITSQAVDTPFLKLGFQTSQVFSARAPQAAKQILKNRVVGTSSGLSFGAGLNPVTLGTALCYTARLDEGNPLNEFANIESLLTSWGKLGFAPESRPTQLGGSTTGVQRQPPSQPPAPPTFGGNSAVGSGMQSGIDRPGMDYRSFPLSRPNPRQCRDACANEARCQAWTYANPGVVSPQAMCFLKSNVPTARANNCCTSGVKAR